jgi:hypothetical protein
MGIFSKPQKQNELALVLDIGSSSVGGALFWMQSTGIPKIIFAMREPIPLEEEISIDKLITLTVKTLNVVVSKICMMGLGRPSRMYCLLFLFEFFGWY